MKHQLDDLTPTRLADLGGDAYLYGRGDVYYSIHVEEISHDDPFDPFILGRPDISYYEEGSDMAELDMAEQVEGEKVILFATQFMYPEDVTDKCEWFYWTTGDGAFFTIDESNRVFPLLPDAYADVRSEAEKAEHRKLVERADPKGQPFHFHQMSWILD